jgi:CubicO group peptidase (beta-lactamase class C family)
MSIPIDLEVRMKALQLKRTKALMQKKAANDAFDSYAVYVRCGDFEHTFFSENVNEDTYFDLASCGKILVTTPLILQAIGEKQLSLDSTLDTFFENVPWDKKNITIKHLLTHTSGIVRHQYVNSERDMVAK